MLKNRSQAFLFDATEEKSQVVGLTSIDLGMFLLKIDHQVT